MPEQQFQRFLEAHPTYKALYAALTRDTSAGRTGRLLAAAAQLVYRIQGASLGRVADDILAYVGHSYPPDYPQRYVARVAQLADLQRKFDQHPSVENLCDPGARVTSDDYSLSLLLSIILTNHRFEIMARLGEFLSALGRRSRTGRLVAVGAGTGYELLLAARTLAQWEIEAYEIDDAIRARAKSLLSFFRVGAVTDVGKIFPLESPDASLVGRYDAVILCELCEHLRDPLTALTRTGEYLSADGRAFVTMAINIAQEDHVFLYPHVESCRRQLRQSGLDTVSEWLAPQATLALPADRENQFKKGNYIAVTRKRAATAIRTEFA